MKYRFFRILWGWSLVSAVSAGIWFGSFHAIAAQPIHLEEDGRQQSEIMIQSSDQEAIDKADDAFWEAIANSTDPDEYRAYLRKFPNGKRVEVAKLRIEKMEQRLKETTEQERQAKTNQDDTNFWQGITNSTDPEDYRAYVRKFPNGKWVELAQSRIEKLTALAPGKKVDFTGRWILDRHNSEGLPPSQEQIMDVFQTNEKLQYSIETTVDGKTTRWGTSYRLDDQDQSKPYADLKTGAVIGKFTKRAKWNTTGDGLEMVEEHQFNNPEYGDSSRNIYKWQLLANGKRLLVVTTTVDASGNIKTKRELFNKQ